MFIVQITWSVISAMILYYLLDRKSGNESHALCPAVPDMQYAGKQLKDLKLIWPPIYPICVAELKETINILTFAE